MFWEWKVKTVIIMFRSECVLEVGSNDIDNYVSAERVLLVKSN